MSASGEQKDSQIALLELIRKAIEQDEALRVKFEVNDKFRFVRERLSEVLTFLETEQATTQVVKVDAEVGLQEGEVPVYVYLYNAKGVLLQNWINMLTPKVFYEYSVNRPIYADKTQIEAMLRAKTDKPQHAYLTVAVKSGDIVQSASESTQKDSLGNPLIRVREGSLKIERLISFTHNGNEYRLNQQGEFVKKS